MGGAEFLENGERDELEFFVKDTGIGIAVDRQRAIFDRFVQADIKDIEAREGAGLGLAITKAYVEMLDGVIWVESSPGNGSTFYFTIPYFKSSVTSGKDTVKLSDRKAHQIENMKVLIVEDDRTSSDFISRIVNTSRNTILFARSGKEAVKITRSNPDLDLILMDIKMSDMNGLEATREIRQFNKDVVIIAQTAYALFGDKEKALQAGCNDYIAKPILKEDLLTLVQSHLKK